MTMISSNVAQTVYHLVSFGDDNEIGLISICAALGATILWSVLSAKLSIPSSQSHALVAGLSGAFMAFLNGAQDGQKFLGVLLLGIIMSKGLYGNFVPIIPVWLMLLCSLMMTLGIALGGMKIIKTLGSKLVKLEPYQGTAADIAASIFTFPGCGLLGYVLTKVFLLIV